MSTERPDPIDAVLERSGIGDKELSLVQDELRRFFERSETPDKPLYLTPQDGSVLTASALARELKEGTPRARSYVKLWVAGNLTDAHPPQSDLAKKFRDLFEHL
jgi:hypothetical protein